MQLHEAILTALLAFPMHRTDATEPDRASRMATKAEAYASVAERATCAGEWRTSDRKPIYRDVVELAAAIVTQDNSESTLRRDIQLGQCRAFECDAHVIKGVVHYAAKGSFQIHRNGMSLDEWSRFEGLERENSEASAWYFTKLFSGGVGRCHSLTGGFAVMSGTHACTSPKADMRARKTRALKVRLEAMMRER